MDGLRVSRVWYWLNIICDWWTYRWIQEGRYFSIFLWPSSTTAFISSTSTWFCLRPVSSSSSSTNRRSRALPRERKDGRFSTVNSGWEKNKVGGKNAFSHVYLVFLKYRKQPIQILGELTRQTHQNTRTDHLVVSCASQTTFGSYMFSHL